MKGYGYDKQTRAYLGKVDRQKDPLGNGWLMPANATDQHPPQAKPGEAALWRGDRWELVADQRSKVYYHKVDRSEYRPALPEETPDPNFYTLTPPPGKSPYEYWDDQAQAWLVDSGKRETAIQAEVQTRLYAEILAAIASQPPWQQRRAEIEDEVRGK